MFKFMKYEIQGTYKFILGVLALVLILFTCIYVYTSNWNQSSTAGVLFMGLSFLILFGSALAVFLYIVGSFRKELYEDRGYLTFTLPLTGNQIVGSKLLAALLWFFILGMVIALYNIIMVSIFTPFGMHLSKLYSMFTEGASIKETVFNMITSVFDIVNLLILIYFSMALSKVTFRNKKIGGLWFVIFLVLSGILALGENEITKWLPYYLDLNTFHMKTMGMLSDHYHMDSNNDGFQMSIDAAGIITTNIAAGVYNVVTTVALFLGCGYLIEKKIDL